MFTKEFARVALVACVFVTLAASAQNQSYLLRSEGAVSVNGMVVSSSALVSDGDVIQTGKGSSAKIAAPGMSMVVSENSRVAVSNGKLAIDHGSASISSKGQIATVASQYAIRPVGGSSARYLVSNYGNALFVTSQSGGLGVTGPNLSGSVASGQKARFTAGNYDVLPVEEGQNAGPSSFGQLIGSYSSNLCRTAASCYCKTAARCPNK